MLVCSVSEAYENAFTEDDASCHRSGCGSRLRLKTRWSSRDRCAERTNYRKKSFISRKRSHEYNFEEIVGTSATLKRALQDVKTVALPTILILEKPGLVKEPRPRYNLSAEAEHTWSK